MNIVINLKKFEQLKKHKITEKKYTILVVDDELANIESLTMILEEDYTIIKAKDGFEALAILQSSNPSRINLIISDQRMPGMTGVEFLKQTIPIIPNAIRIILTSFTDVNDIINSINEGHIYKFLTKPIEPIDLLITVKRALEAYELGIENINLIEQLKQINQNLEKKVEERTRQLQEFVETQKKQKEELEYLIDCKNELVAELQYLSVTDQLTGLANKRRLTEFMDIEWKRAIREKTEISLIMMDIDHFKLYNDYYGHANGDKCLTHISQIILREIRRPADIAVRYGGEEFCCVLPETSLEGAIKITKNLCQAIRVAAIPHLNSPICPYVTLSFGVYTVLPDKDSSWQELLEYADKYLYEAKTNGRNRIYCNKGAVTC
ncbi:MAG: GGDEF domain-containing response regulator [Desulfitobacteriaceae bacterium]